MKRVKENFRAFGGSLRHALDGISFTLRSQRNFRIHLGVAAAVLWAGLALRLSRLEFLLLLLTVIVVLLVELLNTALEVMMNLVEARNHPVVRHAKDIAAGAVLVTALGAAGVGTLLFWPKLCLLWCRRGI